MSPRLAREFQRLYGPADTPAAAAGGAVRALVLDVARPADWRPLAAVWQGVQADLGLPAPAIVANGSDGLQLWFSLAQPEPTEEAQAFLNALRQRYLPDLPLHRVTLRALAEPVAVPARVDTPGVTDERWSSFVAADLAPIFEDTPWLDLQPSDEGQADLLSRLHSISPAHWAAAQALLSPQPPAARAAPSSAPTAPSAGLASLASPVGHPDALRFLQRMVQDEAAPLALRVEAAKALLPYPPAP
jgi:hypothetical protein